MALFPQDRPLNEQEIAALVSRIESEEEASGVQYQSETTAFYVFQGTVALRPITFNIDKKSGLIVTEEEE